MRFLQGNRFQRLLLSESANARMESDRRSMRALFSMRISIVLPVLALSTAVAGTMPLAADADCTAARRRDVFKYCQNVRWSFDVDGTPTTNAPPVSPDAAAGEQDLPNPDRIAFDRAGGCEGDAAAFLRWLEDERSVAGETAFAAGWDDGGVFLLSEHDSEIRCLKRYDVRSGTAAVLTPTNGPHDLIGPIWIPDGANAGPRLSGVRWRTKTGTSNAWSDARMAAAERRLYEAFPGGRPEWIEPAPDAPHRWIVQCRFSDAPPAWIEVDADGGTFRVLSLGPAAASPMVRHVFRWRASDGEALCGIVSFPGTGGPFPLVVFPHGGPGAISDATFDERVWALVDAGFLVLQPNYRGSVGFGKAFRLAGWGPDGIQRAMDDIFEATAAVRADSALPVAKTRPVLLGGSWGGYCALEQLAQHPGAYAGAVSLFGAFDLPALVCGEAARAARTDSAESDRERRTLFRQFADPADAVGMERLAELSPVHHAAALAEPVLLFHNRNDSVIPFAQSEAMFAALTNCGTRAEFRIGEGGHGFPAAEEARIYGEIVDLFKGWTGDAR